MSVFVPKGTATGMDGTKEGLRIERGERRANVPLILRADQGALAEYERMSSDGDCDRGRACARRSLARAPVRRKW